VILKALFGRNTADPSDALYAAIVAAARQEKFYAEWQVPDTMDGRFDMQVLHMYLVLEHLGEFGTEAASLRQALTDRFFAAMDAALREVGVGDLAVGKKVRKMAEAFFGRITAYSKAASSKADLREALTRNIFAEANADHAADLATWTLQARLLLKSQTLDALAQGNVRFE
jgi:cytochrome b pre-mRNA-processing protein 3